MADETTLLRTATRVDELARPRASAGLVALVVLAAEVVAGLTAWGVSSLDAGSADPLLTTVAVVAAAITALTLFVRAGHDEAGNMWLAAAWIVIAVLAGSVITDLPLTITTNPAGPGTDRALLTVLTWTLVLAIGVAGADLRPDARRLPWVLMVVFGGLGTFGGMQIDEGTLLAATGPTFAWGLVGGMVVVVAVGSCAWWLHRWEVRGGWALTWSGVGLVLMTAGTMFQLTASIGGNRAWAVSTALILSSLVVPGIGAAVGGLARAGAQSLARRQLAHDLVEVDTQSPSSATSPAGGTTAAGSLAAAADAVAGLPMLDALDVQLATVVNLHTQDASGAIATACLPGTGLALGWWRAQAASMGLAEKLEVVLAARALDVARRQRADAWLVVPVAANAVSPALLDVLSGPRAGQLVTVLEGSGRELHRVFGQLRERGINIGLRVGGIDSKVMEAVEAGQPSLLVVAEHLVENVTRDARSHAAVADVAAFAAEQSIAVLASGVNEPLALPTLRELGIRYASGSAVLGTVVPTGSTGRVAPSAMELIEAAGLREQAVPGRR